MMYLVLYYRRLEDNKPLYGNVVDVLGLFTDRDEAVQCMLSAGKWAVIREIVPNHQYKLETNPFIFGDFNDEEVFNVAWYLE